MMLLRPYLAAVLLLLVSVASALPTADTSLDERGVSGKDWKRGADKDWERGVGGKDW
ncbi:hypothetical protein JAAARDRAFT_60327 [Jaapia argillacea MUCL 33604]|uniref:Uncharacterized protein n=1 Tax=Jaapia argillacea MUCL 33604 TaxID=933084 RepID=A0A067PUA7_9AGAM|nr:hypothetical protein JAAARDRAFT_60327 [Jaapia argillacea MUCL 33604]